MSSQFSTQRYGGIEAGGTKFICAVGTGPDNIQARTQFNTTTPRETLGKALDFFKSEMEKGPISALGIGSFGPLDLDLISPTYGYVTSTPKAGWSNIDFVGTFRDFLGIPVVLDTDVNAAALGEGKWGSAQGLDTFLYLTVGTGIGGGGMTNGKLMHGLIHPEMGHIRIPHDFQIDPFPGCCPFHGDCLEGLASGKSMERRWGKLPEEIPFSHPGWELESTYIATGVVNFIFIISPQKIVLGGGIMKNPNLLPLVRHKVVTLLNNYISSAAILARIDHYIVPPGLGELSGVLGAIALAGMTNQRE